MTPELTPEQFAKCREFATCYTTGLIGSLLDHIDAQAARIAELERERDLAYAKLAASHDQTNLTADARVFAVYGNKISDLLAERDHLKLHIDVLESKISAILSEPKRPWAAYKQIEDERDALRHDMDRLSAADTEHCTALVAAEARALAAKAAIAKLIAAYDEANPLRTADFHHTSCDCLRCAVDNLHAIAQPKVTP